MKRARGATRRGGGHLAAVAYAMCALYLNVVGSLVLWTLLPAVAGMSPTIITSESMAPRISAGDIVLLEGVPAAGAQRGAVITFEDQAHDGGLVTHRVVHSNADGTYITRGDANDSNDSTPVSAASLRGVGRIVVPAVGTPALWVRDGRWLLVLLWVAGTAMALAYLCRFGRTVVTWAWSTPLEPAPAPALGDPRPAVTGWEFPVAHRQPVRWAAVAGIATIALAAAVAPTFTTSRSAFVADAKNKNNSFLASTSFCTAAGTQTLMPAGDAKILEFDPTANFGSAPDLGVDPRSNRRVRSLLQFSLPAKQASCTLTASLRLYATGAVSGRTLYARRAGAAWAEGAVTWNTRPAAADTTVAAAASPAAPGWVSFNVSSQVAAMYAGTDNGFIVHDAAEGTSANLNQVFDSRTGTNAPQLVLTFGSTPSRPLAPSALTAGTISASRIGLSWQDNSTDETGFVVQRALGGTGSWTSVATVAAGTTTYTDAGLASETTYDYRVRATNAQGDSPASNVASATTPVSPPPPSAPSGLTVGSTAVDTISLTWTDTSTNEEEFVIERSPAGAGTWTVAGKVGPDATSFVSTGLTASTTYDHRVKASNNGGSSGWSEVAAATTAGCSTVAAKTLTSSADTLLLQGAGGDTNYGSDAVNFGIRSLDTSNGRSLVNFGQLSLPGGCAITSATLRVYESSGDTGRAIEAIAAAAGWSEASVTWNTQPAAAGTAVSVVSAVGWNAWNVTSLVGPAGSGAPHGFLVRDAAENSGTALRQYYSPREGSNPPQLVVRFD